MKTSEEDLLGYAIRADGLAACLTESEAVLAKREHSYRTDFISVGENEHVI